MLKLGSIYDFLRLLKAMNVEHTIHDTEVDKSTLKFIDCCKPFTIGNQNKHLVYPSHNTCFGIYAYIGLGPEEFSIDINLNQSDSWKATVDDAKVAVLFERYLAETGIQYECTTPQYKYGNNLPVDCNPRQLSFRSELTNGIKINNT